MTDRELLEAAARAAGINVEWHFGCGDALAYVEKCASRRLFWNPLADDGDALRLAVKLRLKIVPLEGGGVDVEHTSDEETFGVCLVSECVPDPYAATRRAIVRAAAAMAS